MNLFLTDFQKIEVAKHYYNSFSDNAILAATIHPIHENSVDIFTSFGSVYIMIDEEYNQISVHTGLGCHGCVELSKHLQ